MKHSILLRRLAIPVLAALLGISACSSNQSGQAETAKLDRISPLGLGQPDPDALVADALAAWSRGDVWTFLSSFAFQDPDSGEYAVPEPREGGAFSAVTAEELEPLKNSLFPMARLEFARPIYGDPMNVRNNPPTVEVPIKVERDLESLTTERRNSILAQVNVTLRRNGRPTVSWEEYVRQVQAQPSETRARFVYIDRAWRVDGGAWAPGQN